MSDINSSNFKIAAENSQRYIVISCSASLTLYLLATLDKIEKLKLPIVSFEVDGFTGLLAFFLLYIFAGIMLWHQASMARENLKAISELSIRKALMLNPSVICGHKYIRFLAAVVPIALFGIAMEKAYHNLPAVILMVSVFSVPYYFSTQVIYELNKVR